MHQPPNGTFNAAKIAISVSRIDALVKKVEAGDVGRGTSSGRVDQSKEGRVVKKDTGKVETATDGER